MQRDGPDLTYIGFILLAVFGSLVLNEDYLSSNRPSNLSNEHHIQQNGFSYDARLWQDPFDYKIPVTEVKETTLMLDSSKPEIPIIKLKGNTDNLSNNDEKPQCHEKFKEAIRKVDETNESAREVIILAPVVTIGSDNESREQRIRKRYAVVAGLSESGYISLQPTKLNYCFSTNSNDKPYDIRWEYYVHEGKNKFPDVLVIWLNNDKFFSNTKKDSSIEESIKKNIQELLRGQFHSKNSKKFNFNILGPSDSDTLQVFMQDTRLKTSIPQHFIDNVFNYILEPYKWTQPYESLIINIYSPFATANYDDRLETSFKNIKFTRTIGTDKVLAKKLIKELKSRNIADISEVAIIAERDTYYSRNLFAEFCNSYHEQDKSSCENANIYYYLRGLDANQGTPKEKGKGKENQTPTKNTKDNFSSTHKHNLPIGPSQLDYLRRMADEIKDTHNENLRTQAVTLTCQLRLSEYLVRTSMTPCSFFRHYSMSSRTCYFLQRN